MTSKSAMVLAAAAAMIALTGCGRTPDPADPVQLRGEAVDLLADVLQNTPRPVTDSTATEKAREAALLTQYQLHAQALEVLAEFPDIVQSTWLRRALDSPSDGVKYAALLAIAELADWREGRLSRPHVGRVRELAGDANPYLQLSGSYALYKITGQPQAVAGVPGMLRDENANLRAEAVRILSLMPELRTEPVIRTCAEDASEDVQLMVLSRLAVLGDPSAVKQLTAHARNRPYADDRIDALFALGEAPLGDLEPLRDALETDRQEEVRMAAARALGMHGDRSGQKLAIRYLDFTDPDPQDERQDPLHEYRVRFLASLALGAIGDYDASSGAILEVLQTSPSRRHRVAAARAALELLRAREEQLKAQAAAPPM